MAKATCHKKNFIVAIDGTAASGKSTTARGVAKALNWFYLDTGAMYRAVTYKIIRDKVNFNNIGELKEMLKTTSIEFIGTTDSNNYHIYLDNKDISKFIRTPEVDALVSEISAIPTVREKMVREQQKAVFGKNVICEGRDIASVVFPNADLKFYLDCSLNERVTRRKKEFRTKHQKIATEQIRDNLARRDYIDSNRVTSPLIRVPDAICLDTTNLSINEEISFVVNMIKFKLLQNSSENRLTRDL